MNADISGKTSGRGIVSPRVRAAMVDRLRRQGIVDEGVLAAMEKVPRHIFVEEALASRAYEDTALPLGCSQTISQPYVVARMIEALRENGRPLGKVLEVGTGCGYQAAVLACLTDEVYSVERLKVLIEKAKLNMRTLREFKVRLKYTDGHLGLPEAAPFDSIILAAATGTVPAELLQQLAVGGRMILPLGIRDQRLVMIERMPHKQGFRETQLEAVRFVPLLPGIE